MPGMDLDDGLRQMLHAAARAAIEHGTRTGTPLAVSPFDYPPALREPGASFVTLRRHGGLLGCIGTLRPCRPLIADVARNAHHAACSDTRFDPVRHDMLGELDVHIALLSRLEPLSFATEADLLAQLRPGRDGLVIEGDGWSATFLPIMWQRLPDPATFVRALKDKAGLDPDYWSPAIRAARYAVRDV
jgi:AmmeMemoRadiSam system protein A